jgi:hypothetical protein
MGLIYLYLTWRLTYIYDGISVSYSQNQKCLRKSGGEKIYKKLRWVTFSKNRAFLEICGEIFRAGQATSDNIRVLRRVLLECWVTKATNTPSEHVILLAFPLNQCLRERAIVAVVTICTTGFNILPTQCIYVYCMDLTSCPHSVFMCIVWI